MVPYQGTYIQRGFFFVFGYHLGLNTIQFFSNVGTITYMPNKYCVEASIG